MMQSRLLPLLVSFTLLAGLTGCPASESTSEHAPSVPLSTSAAAYLKLPARAVKLNVSLEANETTQMITAAGGGTLTLALKDGNTATLEFPAGALLVDTEIRMQEIKKISHASLPANLKSIGVEISPDGTELKKAAILTLTLSQPLDLSKLSAITSGASGDNASFSAFAETPTATSVKLALFHFSNHSINTAPSIDDLINQQMGSNTAQRLKNWLNRKLQQEVKNGTEDLADVADVYLREMADNVVLPAAQAISSCASAKNALELYHQFSRSAQLLGLNPDNYLPSSITETIGTAAGDLCYEPARKACYDDHRPREALDLAFSFLRMAELNAMQTYFQKFYELADKCGKFRFVMDSEFWIGSDRANASGLTAHSEFDFSLNLYDKSFVTNTIEVTDAWINHPGLNCTLTSATTRPSELGINNFMLTETDKDQDFTVLMQGLTPYNLHKFSCVSQASPGSSVEMGVPGGSNGSSYWGGLFTSLHGPMGSNELQAGTGIFVLKNWDVRHQSVYATKSYNRFLYYINESTVMTIYHTPAP